MKRILLAFLFCLVSSVASATCSISSLPFNLTNGTTADASQVMANFNQIFNGIASGCAASGANTDITSILGTTSGLAKTSGQVGELQAIKVLSTNTTVTFTNSSANIAWAVNQPVVGQTVYFTTTSALPTNFAANTNYYVVSVVSTNIQVSATYNGSAITAGSAGSGTQTGWNGAYLTTATPRDIAAITLTAGDWTCSGNAALYGNLQYNSSGDLISSINTLSANTLTTPGAEAYFNGGVVAANTTLPVANTTGEIDFNSASTTNVYLNMQYTFGGTGGQNAGAVGSLRCRRVS
jgi:hypothetical protein